MTDAPAPNMRYLNREDFERLYPGKYTHGAQRGCSITFMDEPTMTLVRHVLWVSDIRETAIGKVDYGFVWWGPARWVIDDTGKGES